MKKLFIFLFLLCLFPLTALADFDFGEWKYYKNIGDENAGLRRFIVDDEMLSGSERDLRDLRVIASDASEVPYKWVLGKEQGKTTTLRPRILNNSYLPGEHTSVILDFGINHQGVNRLKINTNSANFQRNVAIYGSEDMKEWNILKAGAYIYDYTDKRGGLKSQNTTLNFPESLFHYLKIEISDLNNTPVKIISVTGIKYTPSKIRELTRTPEYSIAEDGKNKNTEVYIDLGVAGIPINRLIVSAGNNNFNRSVSIFSSYDNKSWHSTGQGYIFRYNTPKFTGENLELTFRESNERYVKFVIRNKDDAPLNITGVKTFSIFREVIFEAKSGFAYRVYYGNDRARFPKYDFEKYFKYLNLSLARDVELSAQLNNSKYAAPEIKARVTPKSEETPYLMPTALAVASLLLMYLVYNFLKKKE